MKKLVIIFTLFSVSALAAQSWQWYAAQLTQAVAQQTLDADRCNTQSIADAANVSNWTAQVAAHPSPSPSASPSP